MMCLVIIKQLKGQRRMLYSKKGEMKIQMKLMQIHARTVMYHRVRTQRFDPKYIKIIDLKLLVNKVPGTRGINHLCGKCRVGIIVLLC